MIPYCTRLYIKSHAIKQNNIYLINFNPTVATIGYILLVNN